MSKKNKQDKFLPVIERYPGGKWQIAWKGKQYGPWEVIDPCVKVSSDREHWATLEGRGPLHSIILDGKKHGPFEVHTVEFTTDSRCLSLFKRRCAYWIFLDGREIGPYRHGSMDIFPLDDGLLADLIFTRKGRKVVRRCALSCSPSGSEKQIFFGPNTGESIRDAIEVINASDTDEGVAAEYAYLRLKFQSLGQSFDVTLQALIHRGKKSYDMLEVELEDKRKEFYYFDITSFYGKFSPEIDAAVRS